ncbi:piggyBac transposable element-derived protein 4-like [Oppia nitens]|uniref:piggyBac transposable element-derived protein 4-like n=1 Tax=Oppia nitens TaxID=1686743 RepID=UPI0023DA5ED5|nr:piggyBac transposable element-derived protein 4-like [Oppia nitens]
MARKYLTEEEINDLLNVANDSDNDINSNNTDCSDHNSDSELTQMSYKLVIQCLITKAINLMKQLNPINVIQPSTSQLTSQQLPILLPQTLSQQSSQTTSNISQSSQQLSPKSTNSSQNSKTELDREKRKQTYNNLIDEKEMLAYIGLCILIGVDRSSHENLNDLWDTGGRGRDIFRAVMPLKRFQYITEHLCFDHIASREARKLNGDKLALFSNIFTEFRKVCRQNYEMSTNATIDEMLRPFRGRCQFKQYMPKKPAKYGLKFFIICDSETAYCYDALFYTGKENNTKAKSVSQNVVLELTKRIKHTGRNITTDNWFTSYPLANELLMSNLTLVGTVKHNKKEIPKHYLEKKKRVIGSSEFSSNDNITLVAYYPKKNKVVLVLSSMHSTEICSPPKKPEIIEYYNHTKGGVDTLDQMCATYSTGRKTNRWPTAAFFALLDIMAVNSYIIYRHYASHLIPEPNESKKRREFLHTLGEGLAFKQMMSRLEINELSQDLRMRIKLIIKRKHPELLPKPNVTKDAGKRKKYNANQSRCYLCPRCDNKKATIRCNDCDQLICKSNHMIIYCTQCSDKDYTLND